MTKTKNERDVTRALELVNATWWDDEYERWTLTEDERAELLRILTDMDARTGRRDPSKRTKPTRKKR